MDQRQRKALHWFIGVCAFLALYAYFLRYSWTVGVVSDFANSLLMAHSMLHGNIFLRGWYLSPDPFWLTDLPLYALGVAVRGVTPSLLHDIPALLYTVAVFLAFFLMIARVNGRRHWLPVGLAVLALVAIPPYFAGLALVGPMHIGTLDAVLGLLLLAEYRDRMKLWIYVSASSVLFAIAILSDPFTLWMYYLPLAVYSLVAASRMGREERARVALPFLVATGSLIASEVFKHVVVTAGGLNTAPLAAQFAAFPVIGQNIGLLLQGLAALYGASFFGQPIGLAVVPSLVRLAVAALVLFVVFRTVYRWARYAEGDAVSVVLSLASALICAEYTFSTSAVNMATSRYLVPVVVLSLVASGRSIRLPAIKVSAPPSLLAGVVLVLLLIVPAAQGATSTLAVEPPQQLAVWLAARHLTYGYRAYWDASIVTVYAGDKVRIRQVVSDGPRLAPFDWMAAQRWYTTHQARFLVYDFSNWGNVNLQTAEATWGKPQAVDTVGPYTVAIWQQTISFN